jgi:hypothetical protein
MITIENLIAKGYHQYKQRPWDKETTLGYWLSPNKTILYLFGKGNYEVTIVWPGALVEGTYCPPHFKIKVVSLEKLEKCLNWILLGSKAHLLENPYVE